MQSDFSDSLAAAVSLLRKGEIIAYPTETFYGLAVDPANRSAVQNLLDLKNRSAGEGLPLIIESASLVERWIGEESNRVSKLRKSLQEEHWPGPLTLVISTNTEARDYFSPGVFGPDFSLAVRVSSSQESQALASGLEGVVAATSANPHGEKPPSSAGQVKKYFPEMFVIESNSELCAEAPSTIVDVRAEPLKVLRQGAIAI